MRDVGAFALESVGARWREKLWCLRGAADEALVRRRIVELLPSQRDRAPQKAMAKKLANEKNSYALFK